MKCQRLLFLVVVVLCSWEHVAAKSMHESHGKGHSANRAGGHHGHKEHNHHRQESVTPDEESLVTEHTGLGSGERSYIASNCSRCHSHEATINLTKEAIKQQILNKLGFKEAPNISARALPKIPPLRDLLDFYGMQNDSPSHPFKPGPVMEETEDDYHAKTEKVISFAEHPPSSKRIPEHLNVQYFKFSPTVTNSKVVDARLWIYLQERKQITTTIYVFKMLPERGKSHLNQYAKEEIKPQGGWVSIRIDKMVSEWFRQSSTNFGLIVDALDENGVNLVVTNPSESDSSQTPFIEVRTTEERRRRTKRMVGLNCEDNSNEVRCCRYPLTVDFEEFGWDWIIAPKKYEANYCSGECPFVFLQKYPHTQLVQHANPSGSAGPCCAPRKMSSISMLYFDDNHNIIYGLLPGMVVDKCGCT